MQWIGVVEVNEHHLGVLFLSLAEAMKRFFDRWMRNFLLRPPAQFVWAPKSTVDQRDVHLKIGQPFTDACYPVVGQRLVPSIVVWEEEQGPFGTSQNKGMHVRKFSPVRHLNRFNNQVL